MADGKLELSNGCIYEGDIVNGQPHGKGKNKCEFSEYEGDFVNGEKHGKGKHTVYALFGKHVETYEGDFLNGERTGKGKYTSVIGEYEYEGDFINGEKHGKGKYINCSGVFEGDFVNGDITKGKFTGKNGDTYEGNFANYFRRNGEGKYTSKDGKVEDGYWYDDQYMGAGDAGKLKMEKEEIRAKEAKENRSSDDYYDAWTGEKR
jgi:hypothetical protein